ncbi:MAG: YncE family protein [Deltaproteobacteria bacterium]|nr:YncE family protein [Deltaproteobacteria bacterium]
MKRGALLAIAGLLACSEAPPRAPSGLWVASLEDGTVAFSRAGEPPRVTSLLERRGAGADLYMPRDLALSPDGLTLWVTASAGTYRAGTPHALEDHGEDGAWEHQTPDSVVALDTVTGAITARVRVEAGAGVSSLTLSPDGRSLWVTATDRGEVLRVDTASRRVTLRVPLGAESSPRGVAWCGGRVAVAVEGAKSLALVEPETGAVSAVGLGGAAMDVRCTRDGDIAWVTLFDALEVARVALPSGLVTRVPMPEGSQGPTGLSWSSDGRRLYVCDEGWLRGRDRGTTVVVLDAGRAAVSGVYPVGLGPHAAVEDPDDGLLYVSLTYEARVALLEAATGRVRGTLEAGHKPHGIALGRPPGGDH